MGKVQTKNKRRKRKTRKKWGGVGDTNLELGQAFRFKLIAKKNKAGKLERHPHRHEFDGYIASNTAAGNISVRVAHTWTMANPADIEAFKGQLKCFKDLSSKEISDFLTESGLSPDFDESKCILTNKDNNVYILLDNYQTFYNPPNPGGGRKRRRRKSTKKKRRRRCTKKKRKKDN
jgi:hypothetical protein